MKWSEFRKKYQGRLMRFKEITKHLPKSTFSYHLKRKEIVKIAPGLYWVAPPELKPCCKENLISIWKNALKRYEDKEGFIPYEKLLLICSSANDFIESWKGGGKIRVKRYGPLNGIVKVHLDDFLEAYAQFKSDFGLIEKECKKWKLKVQEKPKEKEDLFKTLFNEDYLQYYDWRKEL